MENSIVYDLKVGYACNNRCKHCVIEDSKDKLVANNIATELTTEECCKQIDENITKGINSIVLTGGEVTIRKDLNIILNKCIEHDLDITIQSNGRNLRKQEVANIFSDIKKVKFVIALHGGKAETHDNVTQVKGSFEETKLGIKNIINLKKDVILKVVISKINASELVDIVDVASELGVKYICFAFPHGQGAARKNFDSIIPRYREIKNTVANVVEKSNALGIKVEFEAIPFCILNKHMKNVGELKYLKGEATCTQVKEETFDWHDIRKSIKQKGANCYKCSLGILCEGVWCEYIEAFGDEELKPIILDERTTEKLMMAMKKI